MAAEDEKLAFTLPEGQEDDRFDGEELEHRLVRPQQVAGGEEEEEERVESQADGEVVDDGDVQVPAVDAADRGGEKKRGREALDCWAGTRHS